MPRIILRTLLKMLLVTLGVFVAGVAGLALWAGSEIASPERRGLQDYHREFLDNPAAHGVGLASFALKDGTPCVMCAPHPGGKPGARGVKVREQLVQRGITLAEPGKITGTLVLAHGRRGRKEDYLLIAERLCAAGFRCLMPDLPAHGDHPAAHAGYGVLETELPARVLTEAAERFGFEPRPAGLLGISMGGSVVVHSAAQADAPWRALVVIASFDSFTAVVEHQTSKLFGGWSGPAWARMAGAVYRMRSGVALTDIQPGRKAASLGMPALIGDARDDRLVPMSAGRRLFDALPAGIEKKWIEIPGADHDNVLITDFPIYAEVAEWMLRHVSAAE